MTKDNSSEKSSGTVIRRVKASGAGSDSHEDIAEPTHKVIVKTSARSTKVSVKNLAKAIEKPTGTSRKPDNATKKPFILVRPFCAFGRYFRDSWRELRQVRWTNRRTTWALTLAVLLFCAFFAIFVLLFDWAFQWLVKEVIL